MYEMRPEVLREFLDRPLPAILATLRRDGSPYTIPLWYLWEGEVADDFHPTQQPPTGHAWFLGGETSTWVRHLQQDSADVALHRRGGSAGIARGDRRDG